MSKEDKKKVSREAMSIYLSRPTASAGSSSSSSTAASAGQPGVPDVPGVPGAPAVPAVPTPTSDKNQQLRDMFCERGKKLRVAPAVVPAIAFRRAASMPIGAERDGEPMDHRLCRAAFRDQLVRSVRHGAIKLIAAYDTQSLRKPPGYQHGGPAREGATLARPKPKCNVFSEVSEVPAVTDGAAATDAGHLCYHIVFHSLLFVADIVRELQKDGIASDVDVNIPDAYRHYNECTAEDSIEAALWCAGSTWTAPGMVRPKKGPRDAVASAGDHLLQLVTKTTDCIKMCWPEGATTKDADRVARSFMDTSESGMRGSKPFARPARICQVLCSSSPSVRRPQSGQTACCIACRFSAGNFPRS